jgi:glutathione S-transferase
MRWTHATILPKVGPSKEADMELYFSPLACSMATRIALYEAGANATFVEVDSKTKRTSGGEDFLTINPLGLVPTLRTDEGELVTENAAILQYVADRFPGAELAPASGMERTRLHQWLCFIGTELHKGIYNALLDRKAPEVVKSYALEKSAARLELLAAHLADRAFLLDRFSIADAYLVTVLTWSVVTPIDLAKYPSLAAYVARLRERPSVAKALSVEFPLYTKEQERAKG